jgi:hypothetical protein
VAASSASNGNGSLLPWQAAMDEVKKRKDLKSIMIIGAGPIVIGQVGRRVWAAERMRQPRGRLQQLPAVAATIKQPLCVHPANWALS